LYKGPNLLDQLPAHVLRFRKKSVACSADIRKAFLTVGVAERDQDYLRFLWWADYTTQALQLCQHQRLVLGLNCSPFALAAVITRHLNIKTPSTEVVEQLKRSFYMDNLLSSVKSIEKFETYKTESITVMANACMQLREWHSSTQPESKLINVLGFSWNLTNSSSVIWG